MRVFGIILLLAGIVMLCFNGFSFQKEEKLIDVGPVEINKKETHRVGWPVYAGGVVALAGVVLIVAGGKKKD